MNADQIYKLFTVNRRLTWEMLDEDGDLEINCGAAHTEFDALAAPSSGWVIRINWGENAGEDEPEFEVYFDVDGLKNAHVEVEELRVEIDDVDERGCLVMRDMDGKEHRFCFFLCVPLPLDLLV